MRRIGCEELLDAERPRATGEKWINRHFTGVHILEPEALARLPEGESDINRTAYVRLIHDGARVLGYLQRGAWADLGAPKSYLRSNLEVLGGRVPLERFKPLVDPWAGASEVSPGIFVHEGAAIDPTAKLTAPLLIHTGCKIAANAQVGPDVVLGRNVRVDTRATVSRAVCWDNTHLSPSERVESAIAAPGVRLRNLRLREPRASGNPKLILCDRTWDRARDRYRCC